MPDLPTVIADYLAEGDDLDRMLTGLTEAQWALPTPAPGWDVAHQVAHLASIFQLAALSAGDPARFAATAARMGDDFDANVAQALAGYLSDPPAALLERWRTERRAAAAAIAGGDPDRIVPWLVRPMPAAFLTAAGIMELFGHGQDIADAVGVPRTHSDRIVHLVEFAIRNRDFGFTVRGEEPPAEEFRIELIAPSGARWTYGPADARQRVTGPAADFCLLTTRRRHRDDLALTATGPDADRWLTVAQAYRGPAGPGRTAGQFASTG